MAKHQQWQNINNGKTSTMAKHQQWQNINNGKTSTMAKHQQWQNINNGKTSTIKVRDDLKFNSPGNFESTFIELIFPNIKFLLLAVYTDIRLAQYL